MTKVQGAAAEEDVGSMGCVCPQLWAQPQAYPNVLAAAALAKIVINTNILIRSSCEDL